MRTTYLSGGRMWVSIDESRQGVMVMPGLNIAVWAIGSHRRDRGAWLS